VFCFQENLWISPVYLFPVPWHWPRKSSNLYICRVWFLNRHRWQLSGQNTAEAPAIRFQWRVCGGPVHWTNRPIPMKLHSDTWCCHFLKTNLHLFYSAQPKFGTEEYMPLKLLLSFDFVLDFLICYDLFFIGAKYGRIGFNFFRIKHNCAVVHYQCNCIRCRLFQRE